MPLINVLPKKQIQEYEQPPIFSASARKYFLTMPVSIKDKIKSFSSFSNKIGFQLMFGYFLARKRFYIKDLFRPKDINFVCGCVGVLSFAFDINSYKQSTYARHRAIILKYFAFKSYHPSSHGALLTKAIKSQIYSWEDHKHIFNFTLEWLQWRHIELPTYRHIQSIITSSVRNRNKKVRKQFNNLLSEQHKIELDKLIKKSILAEGEEYLLSKLRGLSPSDSPKQIRANMENFGLVLELFAIVQPLVKQMGFSDGAIRYFGEFVTTCSTYNLSRRVDKYLYLAGFCVYQRYIFEDWMVRTFLTVCKLAINRASRKEKDRLFLNRNQQNKAMSRVMTIAQHSKVLIEILKKLAWASVSPREKEKQFQLLLPLEMQESEQVDDLQQIKQEYQLTSRDHYYDRLAEESQKLQRRASPILKKLTFNPTNSNQAILDAIKVFQDKEGTITKDAPTGFLSEEDKEALFDEKNKFRISLYKILLFQQSVDAIKQGSLNLKYSFKYKAMDEYLIPKTLWEQDSDGFLDKANLSHLKDFQSRIDDFKKMIAFHFELTINNILKGKNKYFRKRKDDTYYVVTPRVEKEEIDISFFPSEASVPLSEVLATIDSATNFLDEFKHLQAVYRKKRPDKSVFFAGITAYGCNLGIPAMTKAASHVSPSQLENTANWYFNLENINKANDAITRFTSRLPLANLYRKNQEELRTSSDGQKIKVISKDTIFAAFSKKYFDKGKGVVSYGFVDERLIPFYSTIADPYLREAPFVIDGLLHNQTIKSTVHVTDTHGYTEAVFGLMDLLGFGFCPNIAKMTAQRIYTFKQHPIAEYKQKGYWVLPKGYFKEQQMEGNWDEILRLVASLKLKYCKASQVFSRFNSYSKQHPLYAALKQYGRMPKTLHILHSINDLSLRQEGRKSSNAIEASNRFSSAVFFANGGEMIFLTRKDQQIADACKTLIKNVVICWNYLYLTRKVQRTKNPQQAKDLLQTIKTKTVGAWRHINFNGTYDFSDKNLADSFNLLSTHGYDLNIL